MFFLLNYLFLDDINITGVSNTVPMLVSPYNFASDIGSSELLNWNAVEDIDYYEYQLDTSSSFSSPLVINGTTTYIAFDNNGLDTEQQLTGLIPLTNYYWRARTSKNGSVSNWSSVWSFSTGNFTGLLNSKDYLHSIQVYPNPITDGSVVSISLSEGHHQVELELIDIFGRTVHRIHDGPLQDTRTMFSIKNNLNTGIYFLKLSLVEETVQVQKLIVK